MMTQQMYAVYHKALQHTPTLYSATVDLIVIKSTSSQPLDSEIVVKALEERGAQAEISQRTGADVTKITSQPRAGTGGAAPSGKWAWSELS